MKTQTLKHHGLTHATYMRMLERQEGACGICGDAVPDRLCIDHDHVTGQVRGLLCGLCNSLLGMARDDEEILYRAIKYLVRAELSYRPGRRRRR